MRQSSTPTWYAPAAALAFAFSTLATQAAVYQETIDVPLQHAPAKRGLFGKDRSIPGYNSAILSERFAASKEGQKYLKTREEKFADEQNRILIYRCPEVLARANPSNTELIIEIGRQRAYFLVNGLMGLETQISTARSGKYTPLGTFRMTERVQDGKISNLYDVEMPYWMRLGHTEFGVHAGYLPGYPASAGCIRLPRESARLIYSETKPGTTVKIVSTWRPPMRALPASNTASGKRKAKAVRDENRRPPSALPVDSLGQTYGRVRI